ncbi:MAG: MarR family winged helix-turn-helix transcriptional regulator [Terriglobia bacterium]
MSALGKKVLLSSGSMTAAVDRLERGGLVERTFAVADRRARIVRLTAKGSKLIREIFAEHTRDMETAFSCLKGPEKEALASLLRKLGHAVEGRADIEGEKIQNTSARTGRS